MQPRLGIGRDEDTEMFRGRRGSYEPHSALALLMPIETQYVFGAAETPDWSAPRSASILNLDHVPIGIGEVRVGKSTPVSTPHDQPSAKCCDGGDGTFVCLHTG